MPLTFVAPTTFLRRRRPPPRGPVCSQARERNLYEDIGHPEANAATPLSELKAAYRALARKSHPDATDAAAPAAAANYPDGAGQFNAAASAWAILSDAPKRAAYDAMGWPGVAAIISIEERAAQARALGLDTMESESELLAAEGTLDMTLLGAAAAAEDMRPPSAGEHDDACPRSVEEAVWNVRHHEDDSTRYYTLWWIYRFRVAQAESALVELLRARAEPSSLKRRAALALGVVASLPGAEGPGAEAVTALAGCLRSEDYYLRYRAAEALAVIAQRHGGDAACTFPPAVLDALLQLLRDGTERLRKKELAKTGYMQQESLFDFDSLEPDVRAKLEKVFADRRENERRSRRTTMTPQLGVDEVDAKVDQPYEWILKAAGAICALSDDARQREQLDSLAAHFTDNDIPLVRYAAHKVLYLLTAEEKHARALIDALEYGVEHHYTQRVLCRDLGDLGYAAGSRAVAESPMVENSFKILALKTMVNKRDNDAHDPDVRQVLRHIDSLL